MKNIHNFYSLFYHFYSLLKIITYILFIRNVIGIHQMISTYLKHEYFRESHLFVSLPVMIVVIYTFHSHCFLVININFAVRTARSEKIDPKSKCISDVCSFRMMQQCAIIAARLWFILQLGQCVQWCSVCGARLRWQVSVARRQVCISGLLRR